MYPLLYSLVVMCRPHITYESTGSLKYRDCNWCISVSFVVPRREKYGFWENLSWNPIIMVLLGVRESCCLLTIRQILWLVTWKPIEMVSSSFPWFFFVANMGMKCHRNFWLTEGEWVLSHMQGGLVLRETVGATGGDWPEVELWEGKAWPQLCASSADMCLACDFSIVGEACFVAFLSLRRNQLILDCIWLGSTRYLSFISRTSLIALSVPVCLLYRGYWNISPEGWTPPASESAQHLLTLLHQGSIWNWSG